MSVTTENIGKAIHQCGAIEFIMNRVISKYFREPVFLDEILRKGIQIRSRMLGEILKRENLGLKEKEIDTLINDINSLSNKRNIIAHNPIFSQKNDMSDAKIHYFKRGEIHTFDEHDIAETVNISNRVLIHLTTVTQHALS